MRQCVAQFAALMEKKLAANDHKGGWSTDDVDALLARLDEELVELKTALADVGKGNGAAVVAAFEAVDVANFAMMITDRLCGNGMSRLPKNLGVLHHETRPKVSPGVKVDGRWYRWIISVGGDANATAHAGKVFAASDDQAMVAVRDAAMLDKVPRPFEITIARIYRVVDETIQKTSEVTDP